MIADPGLEARRTLERARELIMETHEIAVRYGDERLHQIADQMSELAMRLGHDAGPVEEWRPCPVCGAEPEQHCRFVPGCRMVDGTHPERRKLC
ncbi:hypothetical protein ACFFWC_25540 [Plantactinospora siamensis]|uniref:Uncharacterized protein n=1 Tax=Plantactinospora siamensis TaxID=555372 RepID=A0ABV6NVU9_9ACTN